MLFLLRWSLLLCTGFWWTTNVLQAQDSIAPTALAPVDIPPLFQGCADPLISAAQRQACSAPKIQQFVRENLLYPDSARARGIEGMVVVRFSVSETGAITELELLRNIGAGCGQEALRVVRIMPNFTPASRNGEAISTKMVLPIRFTQKEKKKTAAQYRVEWGATYTNKITKAELKALLRRHLTVRDTYGEIYDPQFITLKIETPNKEVALENRGSQLSKEMLKALKRVRPQQRITLYLTIKNKYEEIDVKRVLEVIP
ncbi:MAG: energy transducer TonB [Aureispira sp.]